MKSRLRRVPPKQTFEQISGSSMRPMRSPSGAKTWTPSKPAPAQPALAQTLPSSSQRMPSAPPR
jgi:hypothetical protein